MSLQIHECRMLSTHKVHRGNQDYVQCLTLLVVAMTTHSKSMQMGTNQLPKVSESSVKNYLAFDLSKFLVEQISAALSPNTQENPLRATEFWSCIQTALMVIF